MYVIQNALRNIFRNKGRNLLMGMILFAIILAAAVSLIISTATAGIIRKYKTGFGSEVLFSYDSEKLSSGEEFQPLTSQQLLAFGESEFLKSKSYTVSIPVRPAKLQSIGKETNGNGNLQPSAILICSDDVAESEDFTNGLRELIKGSADLQPDECMLSQQYAEQNKLDIGDTITVESYDSSNPMPHELKVAGIFSDATMLTQNTSEMDVLSNRNNEILTVFQTAPGMDLYKNNPYLQVDARLVLKEPADLSRFEAEIRQKGLPDYYQVTANEKEYNEVVKPVEAMQKMVNGFLAVVLLLGAGILIFLSILVVRERKYEIGVLRAMGMKKANIATGFLVETLVITAVCLCLGLGAGSLLARPVANGLQRGQTSRVEDAFYEEDIAADPLSEMEIHLNGQAAGEIILIALVLSGVSSIAGIFAITRYEPMQILSERN